MVPRGALRTDREAAATRCTTVGCCRYALASRRGCAPSVPNRPATATRTRAKAGWHRRNPQPRTITAPAGDTGCGGGPVLRRRLPPRRTEHRSGAGDTTPVRRNRAASPVDGGRTANPSSFLTRGTLAADGHRGTTGLGTDPRDPRWVGAHLPVDGFRGTDHCPRRRASRGRSGGVI